MIVTAVAFAENLRKSRIAPAAQVAEFLKSPPAKQAADSTELALAAIQARLVTAFQAEEILEGRWRELTVSNYVLQNVLGYGGMGTVYVAAERKTGQHVAVKLLGKQHKHEAGMRARFQLEARIGIRLDHPRLVKTFELGLVEHLYGETDYCVMELVQGVTLLEGINFSAGRMKIDAACDVVTQAAEGLAYLHERGMVHRDVKPDNILIDVKGQVKLLDFGLILDEKGALGEEFSLAMIFGHDCLGTADFIPPEQSLDSMNVNARADVYSLGCTLFVALAGQRPFPAGNRAEIVRAHRTQPRPRLDQIIDCPHDLAETVEAMMSIDPTKRPKNMQEVIHRLKPYCRRRNWTFNFAQVLERRRRMKASTSSKSRLTSLQSAKATQLNATLKTDAPGKQRDE